ncbi:MAG: C-terminal binding protein [Pseudomonadales bacterium]|nr:C-terminal binding protein [Pseudomonadales bacterium]
MTKSVTSTGSPSAVKKTVVVQLPAQAKSQTTAERYALELEALAPVASIVEVEAPSPAAFGAAAAQADALITSWGIQIDADVISRLERCVVIGVGSVGVDMVDVEAATAAGIVVTNVPDVFIEEVADHALMLLLAAGRRTRIMDTMARSGDWYKGRPLLNHVPRLMGQTLGLLAFGNVARCTAKRARGFGLQVIAHDPYVSEMAIGEAGVEPVSFDELLQRSDYLSVHAPLNSETRHLLDAQAFARMKPGAVVVNTARGGIINEADLIEALRSGHLGAAGLDVLEQEPPAPDNPLFSMSNVILTPHVASATTRMRPETRRRVGREVALVLRGRWPMSCVNPTVLPRVALERWQPYPMNRGPNR